MPDTVNHIRKALTRAGASSSDYDLNPEIKLPAERALRAAAVLIPLVESEAGWNIILTMRSSALKHHPGQIAFPGGKQDTDDATLIATALRESEEEIGLPRTQVDVLGSLASHETVTGFTVTPIVGVVTAPFTVTPEAGEVAEVFQVPLRFLSEPSNFQIQSRYWRRQRRYYYTVPFGPYYIWGATARMLRSFADAIGEQ